MPTWRQLLQMHCPLRQDLFLSINLGMKMRGMMKIKNKVITVISIMLPILGMKINLDGLKDSSEQYSKNIDELGSKGEDASEDGGERVNRHRPKKCKVSGMKHGAKGKASIPKDEDEDIDRDEDTDEDDIEETFERLNQHKPGKQVGTKQCKVDGKKSDKGKGAEGKGTKGKGTKCQSTKGKVGPPTCHSTCNK